MNGRSSLSLFSTVSFLSGCTVLLFVVSLFIFSGLFFVLKAPDSQVIFYLSVLVTAFFLMYFALKYHDKKVFLWALMVVSATFLFSALSTFFYDSSYDGQVYHQETLIRLAKGWNPFFETLTPTNSVEERMLLWSENYAKSAEIAESRVYTATHRIESGKMINFLLLFASFYLAACSLCVFKTIRLKHAVLFAAAAALNPVVLCQLLTFYIDGQLASAVLCLLCLFSLYYSKPTRSLAFILVAASAYFMNIKFTAIIYFVVMAAGFLTLSLLNKKIGVFKRALGIFTASILLGVFVFGFNPYVKNYREHGHPFYPIMGVGKVDIMEGVRPRGFDSMTSVQRFLISVFARSSVATDQDVKVKIPLTVSGDEIKEFVFPDVRTGGFGPFFSALLLIGLASLVLSFAHFKKNGTLYAALIFLLLSVFINPEGWWARYVPQLWLVPLLAVIFLDLGPGERIASRLRALTLLLIFLNVGVVGAVNLLRQTKNTLKISREMKQFSQRRMPLKVDFSDFRSNRARFDEHGIRYVEVSEIPGPYTGLTASMAKVQNE